MGELILYWPWLAVGAAGYALGWLLIRSKLDRRLAFGALPALGLILIGLGIAMTPSRQAGAAANPWTMIGSAGLFSLVAAAASFAWVFTRKPLGALVIALVLTAAAIVVLAFPLVWAACYWWNMCV